MNCSFGWLKWLLICPPHQLRRTQPMLGPGVGLMLCAPVSSLHPLPRPLTHPSIMQGSISEPYRAKGGQEGQNHTPLRAVRHLFATSHLLQELCAQGGPCFPTQWHPAHQSFSKCLPSGKTFRTDLSVISSKLQQIWGLLKEPQVN